jgi:hypothetical protein
LDDSLIETIHLFYLIADDWVSLTPVVDNNQATGLLPVFDDHTYLDLKIIIEDQFQNKLTLTLNPATLVEGNYQLTFPLLFN